jgi:hypothetical protein
MLSEWEKLVLVTWWLRVIIKKMACTCGGQHKKTYWATVFPSWGIESAANLMLIGTGSGSYLCMICVWVCALCTHADLTLLALLLPPYQKQLLGPWLHTMAEEFYQSAANWLLSPSPYLKFKALIRHISQVGALLSFNSIWVFTHET